MNVAGGGIRWVHAALQRHFVPSLVFGFMKQFGDDIAGSLTVQITYILVVTIFP